MYNSDFWEVQLDPGEVERVPNEAGAWYESTEERHRRYRWEDRVSALAPQLYTLIREMLTDRQREAMLLYFACGKTQQEIAEILGISRRVVSQHLFGITRGGKGVGGAVRKIRKACAKCGIAQQN